MPAILQSIFHLLSSPMFETTKVKLSVQDGDYTRIPLLPSVPITATPSNRTCNGSDVSSLLHRTPPCESNAPNKCINAVTIDGGGIRAAAAVVIMDILMDDLSKAIRTKVHGAKAQVDETQTHPADHFQMFGGTSAGGLILMMLGRLRVPTKTLFDTYSDLSKRLFNSKVKSIRFMFWGCSYSGNHAEKLFAKFVTENSCEGADVTLHNTRSGDPDVFVTAVDASCREPFVIRSYDVGRTKPDYRPSIVEAARATTAAPTYFPAKTLGDGRIALDGGLVVNNPTELLISEARRKYGPGVRFGLLLSIGTGEKTTKPFPACPSIFCIPFLIKAFGDMLTDSEKTHKRVEERFRETDLGTYLRINVPDLGNVGLDDYKSISDIVHKTEMYMNTPEMKEIREQIVEVLCRT